MTQNDVLDYSKFYEGKDEPPFFCRECLSLEGKVFIPIDDFKIANKLGLRTREQCISHYLIKDTNQNRLLRNIYEDKDLHKKVYATTSPDFSVDSSRCWQCLNQANILKARICASVWQNKLEESVILTLIWGDQTTYEMAFSNIEKGSVCAVSHQGVEDETIFKEGLKRAVDIVQMESLCWYGKIPDYVKEFYDLHRIVRMQTRNELINKLKVQNSTTKQLLFDL